MNVKTLRVGILGQGRSGHDIHLRWLREAAAQYQVVAVADTLPERHEAGAELGARVFSSYRELLADRSLKLDLVVNALPSFLHSGPTVEILNAGFNVVCEKPQALTVREFDAVVAAARKNRRHYFPFQNSRFYPYFAKIQEVIASGKLGKIVFIRSNWSGFSRRWDWQSIQEYRGGNLLNTGPHPLDHAIVMFGPKMPRVFAKLVSENPFGDADNYANVILHGPGAPTIEVVVNSFQAYAQGEQYNVGGTCGGLAGGAAGLKWRYFDAASAPAHKFQGTWSDKRTYCSETLPWVEEAWTPDEGQRDVFQTISKGFYDSVYEVLAHGARPVIEAAQVRRQIAVIEECFRQNKVPKMKQKFLKQGRS
ncbi:MAG: Gfo/Idh/MocA family oxidoreductase [bacterium]